MCKDNPVPSLDIIIVDTFKQGDLICSVRNYTNGIPLFFTVNKHDVEDYSGKGRKYYKIIENGVETNKVQPKMCKFHTWKRCQ